VQPSRIDGEYKKTAYAATHRNQPIENQDPNTAETLILQCIISGVLIVAVLLISMLNIAPTAAMRESLRQMLTGAETPRELIADVRYFGEEFLGWGPTPHELPAELLPLYTPEAHEYQEYTTPLTADYEPLNPQIPGPSAVPGLWD
jgi:hypothetical protein